MSLFLKLAPSQTTTTYKLKSYMQLICTFYRSYIFRDFFSEELLMKLVTLQLIDFSDNNVFCLNSRHAHKFTKYGTFH